MKIEIRSLDLGRIASLARSMVDRLPSGIAIGLVGTLGAGKTTLVQEVSRAAEIDVADVTSPTFTLLQTHRGRFTLHHLDAYRVHDDEEFLQLGVEELFDDDAAWTLVEWADRVRDVMPTETLWVEIEIDPVAETRSVTLSSRDANVDRCVKQIADDMT